MKKQILLLVFLALGISTAFAQKTFSGTVIGPDGLGLPGVSVIEKANPVNGVSTDIDGNWTLTLANGDAILQFTSIGMKAIEIPAKNAKKLTMQNDSQMLEEVVVTGMGMSREKRLGKNETRFSKL
ncbi:MAG: carboxypeptidase-like regulatory domain-containing protein [Flavobacteriaceae bacterium]|nr:carboxypeptidase-like regulatory domain-containing protein [Flavobacteriaceae bacterium]